MDINIIQHLRNKVLSNSQHALDTNVLNQVTVIKGEEEYENPEIGTKAIFRVNSKGEVYGFMLYGQTGYAVRPYDIVSSCIATLSHFVLSVITSHTKDKIKYKEVKEHYLQMLVIPSIRMGKGDKISKVTLRTMVSNMIELQNMYPDHVKVYIKCD